MAELDQWPGEDVVHPRDTANAPHIQTGMTLNLQPFETGQGN